MKIELAHDILAKKIYDMASTEDKMLMKIHRFISARYAYFIDAGVLLDKNSLNYIRPYIKKLSLEKSELNFIRKSSRLVQRKQRLILLATIGTCLILLLFGVQASYNYAELQQSINKKKNLRQQLNEFKEQRSLAELRAQTLLEKKEEIDQEDLQDIAVIKQIIMEYDSLGQQQLTVAKERDLAQSATLSDLAAVAKEQQDEEYAFQLAAKAWELNNNNHQAIQVLEELAEEEVQQSFKELPQEEKKIAIKKAQRKKGGKLKEKDLQVIFSKENTIRHDRDHSVKKAIKSTKVAPSKAPQVATPKIYQTIQQQKTAPATPIDILPPPNQLKETCATAQKNVNKWFSVQQSSKASIRLQFTAQKQLHFEVKTDRAIELNHIMIFTERNTSKRIDLTVHKTTKEGNIYTAALNPLDKLWLKRQKVVAFSFVYQPLKSSASPSSKKVPLSPSLQNKFLTMSKCLL